MQPSSRCSARASRTSTCEQALSWPPTEKKARPEPSCPDRMSSKLSLSFEKLDPCHTVWVKLKRTPELSLQWTLMSMYSREPDLVRSLSVRLRFDVNTVQELNSCGRILTLHRSNASTPHSYPWPTQVVIPAKIFGYTKYNRSRGSKTPGGRPDSCNPDTADPAPAFRVRLIR